jgi:hypothetical protein
VVSPSQKPLPTQDNIPQKDEDKHTCLKQDSKTRSRGPSDQSLRLRPRGHWHGQVCGSHTEKRKAYETNINIGFGKPQGTWIGLMMMIMIMTTTVMMMMMLPLAVIRAFHCWNQHMNYAQTIYLCDIFFTMNRHYVSRSRRSTVTTKHTATLIRTLTRESWNRGRQERVDCAGTLSKAKRRHRDSY